VEFLLTAETSEAVDETDKGRSNLLFWWCWRRNVDFPDVSARQ